MLSREGRELVLQKHQAGRVLKRLDLRIALETAFLQQDLKPRHGIFVIARSTQHNPGGFTMENGKASPPSKVAFAPLGKVGTGYAPTRDMLGPGGKTQNFGGIRFNSQQPRTHALTI